MKIFVRVVLISIILIFSIKVFSSDQLACIKIKKTSNVINVGDTLQLSAIGYSFDADSLGLPYGLTWSSYDSNATVVNGLFTSMQSGEYIVKCVLDKFQYADTVIVIVID